MFPKGQSCLEAGNCSAEQELAIKHRYYEVSILATLKFKVPMVYRD